MTRTARARACLLALAALAAVGSLSVAQDQEKRPMSTSPITTRTRAARAIPPIDAAAPKTVETATFALG